MIAGFNAKNVGVFLKKNAKNVRIVGLKRSEPLSELDNVINDLAEYNYRKEISTLLVKFFGSSKKAIEWLETENPLLGNKPIEYTKSGRSEKLLKFIQAMLKENKRP
ncbi:MAG: hypothetical protein K0R66_1723 [Gammaproteobacteria bacterium]|nr:hypothetical protein [Gammaproteobacteria bacterium]